MGLRVFTRLTDRVLARLGEDAVLRGEPAGKVAVQHGVEVQGSAGEFAYERIVASMKKELLPHKGDSLVIGEIVDEVFVPRDSYTIDSPPFADNGYTVRVVLLAV